MQINIGSDYGYSGSEALDILILRGLLFLQANKSSMEEKDDLERRIISLLQHSQDGFIQNVERGLDKLFLSSKQAISFLQSTAILNLEADHEEISAEADCLREQTWEALLVLEDVVYLHEALSSWEALAQVTKESKKCWLDQLNKIIEKILYPEISYGFRLIPLNTMRRNRLKTISPLFHDLFPWFEENAYLPENTLEKLTKTLAATSHADQEHVVDPLFRAIQMEDPDLALHLESRAELVKISASLPEIFAQAHEVRWLLVAEEEANRKPEPEKVILIGLAGIALHAVCRIILATCHSLEWRFMAAFCGPYLPDERRLDIFMETRQALETDLAVLQSNPPFLIRVNECLCGRKSAMEMARESFRDWYQLLEQTADFFAREERVTVPENALENLLAMSDEQAKKYAAKLLAPYEPHKDPPKDPWWQRIPNQLGQHIFAASFQAQYARSMGETDKPKDFTSDKSWFVFDLPAKKTDSSYAWYELLTGEETTANDYTAIYRFLKDNTPLCWRALLLYGQKTIVTRMHTNENRLPLLIASWDEGNNELFQETPDAIILAVTRDENSLPDSLFNAVGAMILSGETPQEIARNSEIIWFLYINKSQQEQQDD